MDLLERTRSVFWSEWFWFPPNASWSLLENKPGSDIYYPQTSDLFVSFGVAIGLYLFRLFYEKFVITPFGIYCGIKLDRPRRAPQNDVLEKEYKHKRNPDSSQIQIFAKRTDMSQRQVERWFRLRRNQDKASSMKKFTETGWRFTYYFGIFIYGVIVLSDKEWLWDSNKCWYGFPTQHLQTSVYWYYMIELGFYLSLMFSQFLDVKRKDFVEMFIHHIATVSLMSFSYIGNFIRTGTLVLLIHDCADFWVEGAKLAKYAKADRLCDVLFAVFAIVWFVTRLVCYPIKILNTSWFQSRAILGFFPSLVFFNLWLCLLLVLHVYWFSLIVRVAYAVLTKHSEVDDVRSEQEEPVTDEQENNHHGNNHQYGNNVQSKKQASENNHLSNHVDNHKGNHCNHAENNVGNHHNNVENNVGNHNHTKAG
ncbi:ceramide synthase 6-like isoform X2 [Dreissena polymorpha]|uniref:ceramide synthase 6-like isoform X2 n=1 Tax=Dreissena polymorpha TaxID=45954 RepID=UPI002264E162|nr:ceramide synthase 6-like isoform X2 [Dreissena polymorpha]